MFLAIIMTLISFCAFADQNSLISSWSAENNANDKMDINNGSLHGEPKFVEGISGSAFNFNGNGDFITIDYNDSFNFGPDSQFTISAWMNLQKNNGWYQALIVKVYLI